MSQRRKRHPTAAERALWQAVVKDAKPLRRRRARVLDGEGESPSEASPDSITIDSTTPESTTPESSTVTPDVGPVVHPPGQTPSGTPTVRVKRALPGLAEGSTAGIDRRTADRFRKGRMDIDGRLDLHGMTEAQAHGALRRFVRSSAAQGKRCLLVITGKGTRGEGVIRRAFPHWLDDPDLRPVILSYTHAQQRDGGQGAFYVLLRRRRE